ncbi:MAG: hypothetical protein AB1705_08195, partial [Verrucomicrobiota bacterium]
ADLKIMARVLEKALALDSGRSPGQALGIPVMMQSIVRVPMAMHLEDYGVLFEIDVPFALVAPPDAGTPQQPAPTPGSLWEQTQRELHGPRRPNAPGWEGGGNGGFVAALIEYNAERVELLKEQLLSTFKEASNIRHLKGADRIIFSVFGGAVPPKPGGIPRRPLGNAPRPRPEPGADEPNQPNQPGASPGGPLQRRLEAFANDDLSRHSTMRLIAKKADVDAFAKGTLAPEQFKQKVTITVR